MPRRMAPHNQRFEAIPRRFESGAVYVAEFANGIVKVGFSRCPRYRLVLLSHEAKRNQTDIARFHVGPDLIGRRPYTVETLLIETVSRRGTAIPGKREFFNGVSFEVAAAILDGICADVSSEQRGVCHAAHCLAPV